MHRLLPACFLNLVLLLAIGLFKSLYGLQNILSAQEGDEVKKRSKIYLPDGAQLGKFHVTYHFFRKASILDILLQIKILLPKLKDMSRKYSLCLRWSSQSQFTP